MTKKVLGRYGNDRQHWVGDGFPVRSLFSYDTLGRMSVRSSCSTTQAPTLSSRRQNGAGSVNIPTGASRPSPSSLTAKSNIAIPPATAA